MINKRFYRTSPNTLTKRSLTAWLLTLGSVALPVAAAQPETTGAATAAATEVQAQIPIGAAQPAPTTFYDLPEDHWAYGAVQELTRLGILTGYPDGRFDGTRATTRYELAVVAARLIGYTDEDEVRSLVGGAATGSTEDTTAQLEARIVALEAALNASEENAAAGSVALQATPGVEVVPSQDATPAVAASAGDTVATPLPALQVQFSVPPTHPFYVGVSPGVVSTAGDVYLSVQSGYDGLLGPVGPAARLTFNGGNRELRIAFDALARADVLSEMLQLYGGLGFGGTVRPSGGAWLLEAPFGAEYFLTPRVGLYLQLTTSYSFTPVNEVDAELSTGFNLRF